MSYRNINESLAIGNYKPNVTYDDERLLLRTGVHQKAIVPNTRGLGNVAIMSSLHGMVTCFAEPGDQFTVSLKNYDKFSTISLASCAFISLDPIVRIDGWDDDLGVWSGAVRVHPLQFVWTPSKPQSVRLSEVEVTFRLVLPGGGGQKRMSISFYGAIGKYPLRGHVGVSYWQSCS